MSEWISVKDRPPEPGAEVLVLIEGHPRKLMRIGRYIEVSWLIYGYGGIEPTYWMPLPDPPEEDRPKKKTHYDWWPYIRGVIRKYPARCGMELHGLPQREQEAVQAAIDATERMVNGKARLKVIQLVHWNRAYTLEGAALSIPCSKATANRWQRAFFEMVARNRDMLE